MSVGSGFQCVETILVVDDEVEFVGSVRRHLKRLGFTLDTACNGKKACEKMLLSRDENRFYDLVITDVMMPRMDGFSLMQWIQQAFPSTSIVVLSEFFNLLHMKSKIRPELDEIGRKPMTPQSMVKLIESISRKRVAIEKKDFFMDVPPGEKIA